MRKILAIMIIVVATISCSKVDDEVILNGTRWIHQGDNMEVIEFDADSATYEVFSSGNLIFSDRYIQHRYTDMYFELRTEDCVSLIIGEIKYSNQILINSSKTFYLVR